MKKIFCNMLSVIKKSPPAFILAMVALLGVLALSGSVQAVEVDASLYQVLYGDIDGDGNKDIYLAPKPEYTPEPGGNGFKLLAQASGYAAAQLDNDVDITEFTNSDFQLIAGDFNGDGVVDVLVQSTRQSLLSFTLANNLVESVPYILQTFASLASDTHSIVVNDINNDGRDDITYTTNGQNQNLYASNQGHLQSTSQAQVTAHYGYDYLNKRRYKVVEEIGENREGILYIDDNTELRDGQLQKYITLGGQKVARSAQGGGEFSPSEFYLNNHLGSVALTLDDSAQVKNAFTYQPFGGKQIAYGNTELSPYGFTGKEQDPETQLGYFHHRYLNTQVGQFITPDPVFAMNGRFTDPQAWSPYAYARNNPITYIDPDGQVFFQALAAIGIGALVFHSEPANAPNVGEEPQSTTLVDKVLTVSGGQLAKAGSQATKSGIATYRAAKSARHMYHENLNKIATMYSDLKASGLDSKTIFIKVSDARNALKIETRSGMGEIKGPIVDSYDKYRHLIPGLGKKFDQAKVIRKNDALPVGRSRADAYDISSKKSFENTSPWVDRLFGIKVKK